MDASLIKSFLIDIIILNNSGPYDRVRFRKAVIRLLRLPRNRKAFVSTSESGRVYQADDGDAHATRRLAVADNEFMF